MMSWCLAALWTSAALAAPADVWVVHGDPADRPLKRAVRKLERRSEAALQPMTGNRWCVTFGVEPTADLEHRAARWLGHPPEVRADCNVGAYPLGRGWFAYIIRSPAPTLEVAVSEVATDLPLYQRVLHRPLVSDQPVRLCVASAGLSDPLAVSRALQAHGLQVDAVYEVGGCTRP